MGLAGMGPRQPCPVMTGELKSKIDRIWDAFWSGGISNPLKVIEQITYLLFIRRLDDLHILAENKANRAGKPITKPVFPEGVDEQGRPWSDLRWCRFKDFDFNVMYEVVDSRVFPFLRTGAAYAGQGFSRRRVGAQVHRHVEPINRFIDKSGPEGRSRPPAVRPFDVSGSRRTGPERLS